MLTRQSYSGRGSHANNPDSTVENDLQTAKNRPLIIWKSFPELEHLYEISSLGAVRNLLTKEPVKTYLNKGFLVLAAKNKVGGKVYRPAIHRAVALAFVPNPNGYEWARAIDPKKPVIHADNLQWVQRQIPVRGYSHRAKSLAWSRLTPQIQQQKLPVNQAYTTYILDRLFVEGRLSKSERDRAGITQCEDDSMSPVLPEGVEFVATPVSPLHYHTLVGRVVAVVVKAERFAFYLGRVASVTPNYIRVSRDNSQWSDRIESRSVIDSIARVVSVLETAVS